MAVDLIITVSCSGNVAIASGLVNIARRGHRGEGSWCYALVIKPQACDVQGSLDSSPSRWTIACAVWKGGTRYQRPFDADWQFRGLSKTTRAWNFLLINKKFILP